MNETIINETIMNETDIIQHKCKKALILKSLRLMLKIPVQELAKKLNTTTMYIYKLEGSYKLKKRDLEKMLMGMDII